MTESFAALFEASELNLNVEKGAVIQGIVVSIDSDWVTVDTGLKSEGVVSRSEFLNEQRELEVNVGDTVDVVVEALDNGMGQTVLSREKAKRAEPGLNLKKSLKMAKSLLVLSLVRLKVVSLLTSVLYVHSCQVLWLTLVRFATQLTLKVKSWSSRLSSLMLNAITLWFLVVP